MTSTDTPGPEATATASATATSIYLQGPFAPVQEEVTVTELAITGALPQDLDGRYLRIGPNPVGEVDPATYHWFLGDGMVHGLRLRDGRAEWYRNRWVRSTKVAGLLDESPPRASGGVERDVDFAANTNVIGHAGRTYALMESGPPPYELTDELETVGPCDFEGTLPGGYTAHPHRDPVTGELHAVSYRLLGGPVTYSVLGTDGRIRRTVDLEVPDWPLMHDFALTENHVVLLDLPVTLDLARVPRPTDAAGRVLDSGVIPYSWNPEHPARIGVLPRDGAPAEVRWFGIDPCYVYHLLNAYEERSTPDGPLDRIVVDGIRCPTMFVANVNGPDNVGTLHRWTVDLFTGKVVEERLDDYIQEFPRHDERRTGHPYRYGYAIGLAQGALLKQDLATKTTAVRGFDPGDVPNEFLFVPATDVGEEDDGVVMGYVQRAATGLSDLVLLDAATLETVATVHLPVRVPYGFHGNWVPA
jgi:carotenoid cleavage oxygenase